MAMVKKSITVTDQQDAWIQSQIASGDYASDSELIREALREKQSRLAEIETIRAKLIHAEQSGFTQMTRDEIRDEFKAELRADGDL